MVFIPSTSIHLFKRSPTSIAEQPSPLRAQARGFGRWQASFASQREFHTFREDDLGGKPEVPACSGYAERSEFSQTSSYHCFGCLRRNVIMLAYCVVVWH